MTEILTSTDPATGDRVEAYSVMSAEEVESTLDRAAAAFSTWSRTTIEARAQVVRATAGVLRDRCDDLAELMAVEMGKPLAQGRSEVEKCAWVCEYYAENAASFLSSEPVETDASRSYVAYRPLGVVLAVMPWNYPLWQVFRFLAPALMAGNGAALKHASNVTGCALAIEEVVRAAGLPADVFCVLRVPGERIAQIIGHPHIAAVTLTGSTPAGRSVAQAAGQHLKKCVLELGGSDPYVIFEDADIDAAVEACVTSRLLNTGQSCIAAKRFILPRGMRAQLEPKFVEAMSSRTVGAPLLGEFDLGPMARPDLRDELHHQVTVSVAKGAQLLCGGEVPEGPGAFYPPTVLSDVRPGMPAWREELFGPVAALIWVDDEEEALLVANDTPFGLGAAVFCGDAERGARIAEERLEAGCCFVNGFVRSDPRLPFGGIGDSGFGRELGPFGIREFVNIKTVYVA